MMLAAGAIGKTITLKANTKTYLPDILDLKGKVIKYIDVLNGAVDYDSDGQTITTGYLNGCYLNLLKADTKELFIKNEPLTNFQYIVRRGVRDNILKIVDFPNSWIENTGNADVNVFIVFWYDDFQIANIYSEDDKTNIDSFEVEQFNNTQKKMMFDENRTMYDKQIQDFFVILNDQGFITPRSKTSVNDTVIKSSYLTLQKNNFEFLRNIPLVLFANDNVYHRIKLQNVVFDFSNSYITIPAAYAANVTGKSYFFNVEYKQD